MVIAREHESQVARCLVQAIISQAGRQAGRQVGCACVAGVAGRSNFMGLNNMTHHYIIKIIID